MVYLCGCVDAWSGLLYLQNGASYGFPVIDFFVPYITTQGQCWYAIQCYLNNFYIPSPLWSLTLTNGDNLGFNLVNSIFVFIATPNEYVCQIFWFWFKSLHNLLTDSQICAIPDLPIVFCNPQMAKPTKSRKRFDDLVSMVKGLQPSSRVVVFVNTKAQAEDLQKVKTVQESNGGFPKGGASPKQSGRQANLMRKNPPFNLWMKNHHKIPAII